MSTNPIATPPSDRELSGLPALAPRLADALRGLGYGVGGLRSLLGDDGLAALDRANRKPWSARSSWPSTGPGWPR